MGVQWSKENPNPRVHRSSGKLGEPRFPLERVDPRVGIFLSPLDAHDGFYLSYSASSYICTLYIYTAISCNTNYRSSDDELRFTINLTCRPEVDMDAHLTEITIFA